MEVETRVVTPEINGSGFDVAAGVGDDGASCPRCENDAPVRLEKADPQANTCYRCRTCGHIFSPRD